MDLVDSLNAIADKYEIPVIISTHPRTRNMINEKGIEFNPLVKMLKPLGFNDYVKLQTKAKAVISDSGTISEESSILQFRALNIRQAHERPEAMEEASVMMVGLKKERILQGLEILETQQAIYVPKFPCLLVGLYGKLLRMVGNSRFDLSFLDV